VKLSPKKGTKIPLCKGEGEQATLNLPKKEKKKTKGEKRRMATIKGGKKKARGGHRNQMYGWPGRGKKKVDRPERKKKEEGDMFDWPEE